MSDTTATFPQSRHRARIGFVGLGDLAVSCGPTSSRRAPYLYTTLGLDSLPPLAPNAMLLGSCDE